MSGDKPLMSPYDCDKAKVLQEARAFSESPLDPRKCCHIITKILYLLWSGEEPLTTAETSTLFFGVTRLFQSSDDHLRRMIYMLLKELPVASAEAFIVTSSLTKDLTSGSGKHRANAVRVLSRIVDPAMAAQIERYLKTAVVDKNTFVASSALVCGINLFSAAPEVIRRWGNEIQGCIQHHSTAATAASSRSSRAAAGGGFLRKAADASFAASATGGSHFPAPMVQLHALVLLHRIKSADPLALQKSLCELVNSFSSSPVAECFLLRYIKSLFEQELEAEAAAAARTATGAAGPGSTLGSAHMDSQAQQQQHVLLDYIESCTRHRHEMVMFEAARALCELAADAQQQPLDTSATATAAAGSLGSALRSLDLSGAITVLQILLSSPKPVIRFAAVREVHHLAQRGLAATVSRCSGEIEPLLNDANRSTATLAFTTLLKTGQEGSVERLLKQISSFSGDDVSDAFRLDIVRAVLQLCLQYPSKYKTLMGFLGSNLREEGSLELKTSAVDALIQIVRLLPQAQELGLLQLCEFIEDCEYPTLCTSILAFLGDQAPTTATPSKFIRFIYNRLILENAVVRAAGVDALAKIASRCFTLLPDVLVLLEACLADNDDEVRDRANLYYVALQQELKKRQGSSSAAAPAGGTPPGTSAAGTAAAGTAAGAAGAKGTAGGKGRKQAEEGFSFPLLLLPQKTGGASTDHFAVVTNHVAETSSVLLEESGSWRQSVSRETAAVRSVVAKAAVGGEYGEEQDSPTASTCDEGMDEEVPSIDQLLNPEPPVALEALCTALQQLSSQPQLQEQQQTWDEHQPVDSSAETLAAETLVEKTLAALPTEQQWREQREREAAAAMSVVQAASGAATAAAGLHRLMPTAAAADSRGGGGGAAAATAAVGDGRTSGLAAGAAAAAGASDVGAAAAARAAAASAGRMTAGGQQQQRMQRQTELLRVLGSIITEETLGELLHSSLGAMLTEKEAEYAVEVVKHVFVNHVVLEFHIRNTVENQTLENISVKVTPPAAGIGGAAAGWRVLGETSAAALPFNASCVCYTLLQRPALAAADLAVLPAVACYTVKEAGDDIGYEDEYPVEHVVLGIADYMAPKMLRQGEFQVLWQVLEGKGGEETKDAADEAVVGKFSLNFRTLDAAVAGLLDTLHMAACEKSDVVDPHKATHTLLLSGIFLGSTAVISKAMLFMSPEHGCLLKLAVRSDSATVARTLLQAFE